MVLEVEVALDRVLVGRELVVDRDAVVIHRYVRLTRGDTGEFIVHHAKGSTALIDDFRPLDDPMAPKSQLVIGGAPSDGALPFFNVEWPGKGMIIGVGGRGSGVGG